jgi:hypothetical protein
LTRGFTGLPIIVPCRDALLPTNVIVLQQLFSKLSSVARRAAGQLTTIRQYHSPKGPGRSPDTARPLPGALCRQIRISEWRLYEAFCMEAIRCAKRETLRLAAFLCTTPYWAARMSAGSACISAAVAALASPAWIAVDGLAAGELARRLFGRAGVRHDRLPAARNGPLLIDKSVGEVSIWRHVNVSPPGSGSL